MKLKKETINELGAILKEEFGVSVKEKDLEKLAYTLTGFVSLLMRVNNRQNVRKSSDMPY